MACSQSSKLVCAVFGVGPGIGAAVAHKWASQGYTVALIGRSKEKGAAIAESISSQCGGKAVQFQCDVGVEESVKNVVNDIESKLGPIGTAVYNASGSSPWKPYDEITAMDFENSLRINALGLFHVSQQVCPRMVERGSGTLAITGATASLRGKPFTTAFAAGKAAQRSLAQSLARGLSPKGVHVFYVIVDGMVGAPASRQKMPDRPDDSWLEPADIADTYWALHSQPKSCWTFELLDIRPNVEPF